MTRRIPRILLWCHADAQISIEMNSAEAYFVEILRSSSPAGESTSEWQADIPWLDRRKVTKYFCL